MSSRTDKPL